MISKDLRKVLELFEVMPEWEIDSIGILFQQVDNRGYTNYYYIQVHSPSLQISAIIKKPEQMEYLVQNYEI